MRNSESVSIIVPIYNRGEEVTKTLDSVINQTFRPIDLILVDDGSSDDTGLHVKRWLDANQQPDFSVRYFLKNNGGPASARNLGISVAIGKYIYFLDSDDVLYPNCIALAAHELASTGYDMLLFGFDAQFPSGESRAIFRRFALP